MKETILEDIGNKDYKEVWDYQEQLFSRLVEAKKAGNSSQVPNHLILCEHPHVYTIGKNGNAGNMLINKDFLQRIGADYYQINRGGDITYHGPGQLVGYPILDLESFGFYVKEYIFRLEETIINTLGVFGLEAGRSQGATGVWLDEAIAGKARKICAIGVRTSHWVSMHGFALNVNTDLNYFNYINPCGFTQKGVTSMSHELGRHIDMNEVKHEITSRFADIFDTVIMKPNKK